MQNPDDFSKRQILRYVTIAFSVFCEFLVAETERVQNAALTAMKLIITHGLSQNLFRLNDSVQSSDITAILSLDALTISQEVDNIRNDRRTRKQYAPQDKLLIHICYLLSTRFEEKYDMVLKVISAFILKVGVALNEKQIADILIVVTEMKIVKVNYLTWNECIGSFLQAMGAEAFFKVLPLKLTEHDLNSLRYA